MWLKLNSRQFVELSTFGNRGLFKSNLMKEITKTYLHKRIKLIMFQIRWIGGWVSWNLLCFQRLENQELQKHNFVKGLDWECSRNRNCNTTEVIFPTPCCVLKYNRHVSQIHTWIQHLWIHRRALELVPFPWWHFKHPISSTFCLFK